MIFKPNSKLPDTNLNLDVGEVTITESKSLKLLGVLFDNKLSFKPQIDKVIGKLRNSIKALILSKYT